MCRCQPITKLPFKRSAPKRVIPIDSNPLARWSKQLRWNALDALDVEVGMEGCQTALNATNAIRTAWFFRCCKPIHLINVQSFDEIHAFQRRSECAPSASDGRRGAELDDDAGAPSPLSGTCLDSSERTGAVVQFGSSKFDSMDHLPLTLIENYASGAQSIHSQRLAFSDSGARVLIGHENHGIQDKYWDEETSGGAVLTAHDGVAWSRRSNCRVKSTPQQRQILYLPQWGTVSSVNVVSCLGVVLFYAKMDRCYPTHRTLLPVNLDKEQPDRCGSLVRAYYAAYPLALPKQEPPPGRGPVRGSEGAAAAALLEGASRRPSQSRVDSRPIHPVFYGRSLSEIETLHKRFLEDLRALEGDDDAFSLPRNPINGRPLFGVSLLYENDVDQRNFGGIVRNANAFLADHVFYVGRRKLNVVGAVGCHRYSTPVYLGALPKKEEDGEEGPLAVERNRSGIAWIHEIRRYISLETRKISVWLLSCGQEFLYESEDSEPSQGCYDRLRSSGKYCSLSECEERIRRCFAAVGRDEQLVLLVPQEGRLPHPSLLSLCTGIITVDLPSADGASGGGWQAGAHRGLPSQVASAIALHRLTTVLHSRLRW